MISLRGIWITEVAERVNRCSSDVVGVQQVRDGIGDEWIARKMVLAVRSGHAMYVSDASLRL